MHLLAELLHCPIYFLEFKIWSPLLKRKLLSLSILKSIMKWPYRITNLESFRLYLILSLYFRVSGASASVLALITHASAIIY